MSKTYVEVFYHAGASCENFDKVNALRRPSQPAVSPPGCEMEVTIINLYADSKADALRVLKKKAQDGGWLVRGKTWLCPACAMKSGERTATRRR